MGKKSIFGVFLFLFIISISLVNAQPPFEQSIDLDKAMVIKVPQQGMILAGAGYDFHFHLFNQSDGLPIDNSLSPECNFHLYNPFGSHIVRINATYEPTSAINEWEAEVLGGNFSNQGEYTYIIQCFIDGEIGGIESIGLLVTNRKLEITTAEALIFFVMTFGVLILFIISAYFLIVIPYSNKKDDKGIISSITKLKYVKLALVLLTWVLFTWVLNILIGISDNFVSLSLFYGFFGFMFETMNNLALPLGIVILVIAGYEIVRDTNALREIKKFGSSNNA